MFGFQCLWSFKSKEDWKLPFKGFTGSTLNRFNIRRQEWSGQATLLAQAIGGSVNSTQPPALYETYKY